MIAGCWAILDLFKRPDQRSGSSSITIYDLFKQISLVISLKLIYPIKK